MSGVCSDDKRGAWEGRLTGPTTGCFQHFCKNRTACLIPTAPVPGRSEQLCSLQAAIQGMSGRCNRPVRFYEPHPAQGMRYRIGKTFAAPTGPRAMKTRTNAGFLRCLAYSVLP